MKTILKNIHTTVSLIIKHTISELQSHRVDADISLFRTKVEMMLLSLALLISIFLLMMAIFISTLLPLLVTSIRRVGELFGNMGIPGLSIQYISSKWTKAMKSVIVSFTKRLMTVWKKDDELAGDYTFHSAEIRKELRYKNEQHERAMKAPIKNLDDKLRKHL